MLVGIFSELDALGGVQRAGRHLAAVLADFAAGRGMDCRLLSLNGPPELHRLSVGDREFAFTGSAGGKGQLITAAIRAARRHAKLVLAAHPNLGPVTQAMRVVAPRLKTIICTHGIEVWEPLSTLRRRALCHADLVLAPSRSTAEHLATHQKVRPDRIRVLPWALDPDFETFFGSASSRSLPPNFPSGRIVLTVGRWASDERYKGMDTLITSLPRLLTQWPEIQLVMVGQGDDGEWLEHLAEKNGVRRHVHFFTSLSKSELQACYSACEIFALPSRGEGFGLVYLEAMAYGKPVIGGTHGGAPEVIDDGVSGYLVQHGDNLQLATSIETLLANPALAREMGARGRQRVQQDFRFSAFAKSLKKILRELCEF
ncbi:MAG TPA: glycosyltransferase family 4 protein [Candidatus Dormibacteraeota bacterium]|nr:glycosyltransferase family 4 protein [Candidatus Dormibacteraeota bacterium]